MINETVIETREYSIQKTINIPVNHTITSGVLKVEIIFNDIENTGRYIVEYGELFLTIPTFSINKKYYNSRGGAKITDSFTISTTKGTPFSVNLDLRSAIIDNSETSGDGGTVQYPGYTKVIIKFKLSGTAEE